MLPFLALLDFSFQAQMILTLTVRLPSPTPNPPYLLILLGQPYGAKPASSHRGFTLLEHTTGARWSGTKRGRETSTANAFHFDLRCFWSRCFHHNTKINKSHNYSQRLSKKRRGLVPYRCGSIVSVYRHLALDNRLIWTLEALRLNATIGTMRLELRQFNARLSR
jgi:hypothetical protein